MKIEPKKAVKTTKAISKDIPLVNSSVYQEFLAERAEILKFKWIESEKAGYDIGYDRALIDWIMNHRNKWRTTYRKSQRGSR